MPPAITAKAIPSNDIGASISISISLSNARSTIAVSKDEAALAPAAGLQVKRPLGSDAKNATATKNPAHPYITA